MNPSIIYCSPQGSGKTIDRQELLERFNLDKALENWNGQLVDPIGMLALTHLPPSTATARAYMSGQELTIVAEGWKTKQAIAKLMTPDPVLTSSQLRLAISETIHAMYTGPFGGALPEASKAALQNHLQVLLAEEAARASADK